MSKAARKEESGAEIVVVAQPASTLAVENASLLGLIERAAKDPTVDINKMERLFEMRERAMARQAEVEFNTAMALAQAELRPVVRKLKNKQTNSLYADLAAISETADPIIHKHGFGVIASEFRSLAPDHLGIVCEVTHSGGHSKRYEFNVPVDGTGLKGNANKTATHAYASTITYGRRYAKCSVFDIATKNDMDGNRPKEGDSSDLVSPEQTEAITKKIAEVGANIDAFLKLGEVDSVSDIRACNYDRVMALLERKKLVSGK